MVLLYCLCIEWYYDIDNLLLLCFNASMMNNNSCDVLCYVWCNVVNYDILLF